MHMYIVHLHVIRTMSLHTCLKKAIAGWLVEYVCVYDATYTLCLQCIIGMCVCITDNGGASVLDLLITCAED